MLVRYPVMVAQRPYEVAIGFGRFQRIVLHSRWRGSAGVNAPGARANVERIRLVDRVIR